MGSDEDTQVGEQSGEISLFDLVRPLLVHWKILVVGFIISILLAGAAFLLAPRVYRASVDFSVAPINYATYSGILALAASHDLEDEFFAEGKLGIEPKKYFILQEDSKDAVSGLGFFALSYPAPFLKKEGLDLFKGYLDGGRKLVQVDQDSFMLSFITHDGNEKRAKAISSSIASDFLSFCFAKGKLDEIVMDMQAQNINDKLDVMATDRELQRQRGLMALLEQYQREYPSLIRSNLTLNEQTVPVEVQLMNVRSRIKGLSDAIDDYYINQARLAAYQRFGNAYRQLGFQGFGRDSFSAFLREVVRITDTAFAVDETVQSAAPQKLQLQPYLDLERKLLLDNIERTTTPLLVTRQFQMRAEPSSKSRILLILLGGICLSFLAVYGWNAYGVIKKRYDSESAKAC